MGARIRKRVSRVALPSVSSSRPVASGSSVPQWPIFFCLRSRRTFCTTSCEVRPGSLSTSSSPSFISTGSDSLADLFGHCRSRVQGGGQGLGDLLPRCFAVPFEHEPGGIAMAAAAMVAGVLLDVDLAAAAQRDLVRAVLALADQGHGLDA